MPSRQHDEEGHRRARRGQQHDHADHDTGFRTGGEGVVLRVGRDWEGASV